MGVSAHTHNFLLFDLKVSQLAKGLMSWMVQQDRKRRAGAWDNQRFNGPSAPSIDRGMHADTPLLHLRSSAAGISSMTGNQTLITW